MNSIYIFLFFIVSNAQTAPLIEVTANDERDLYSAPLGHDILHVQGKDQALYRDTGDLLTFIPNSNFSGGSNRVRFLQFRGSGETSQYENTPTHSISYLVDGVDVTGVLAHWPLLDVSEMRVEKQPASILYGGQAVGGVVETSLHRKSDSWRARGTVDSRLGHGADASVPLSKHRLSLHYNNDAGYVQNTFLDESGNSRREIYGSFVSDWAETDRLSVSSTLLWAHFRNRYDVWSLRNDDKTGSDRPGKDNLNMVGGAVDVGYALAPRTSLHAWVSLLTARSLYSYDSDWSNNPHWLAVPGWNAAYDYYDEFRRQRRQLQARLSLKTGDFVIGAHLQNLREYSDSNGFKNGIQRSNVVGNFGQTAVALHAGYTHWISEATRWNISLRSDSVNTEYRDHQTISENFREPQWAASTQIDHAIGERHSVFATVRRGYKNPIINIDPDTPQVDRRVGSERALHFEAGHVFRGSDFVIAHSVFARWGDDQQVRVSRQIDINDPSSYVYYYDNAAKTGYYGYEIGAHKNFAGGAQVRASTGLLRARFSDYVFDGQVLTDRAVAHAPQSTWAVQWLQPFAESWSVIAQGEGKSAFYYSNNHGKKNSAYALAHLALRYSRGAHEWDLGVRNLFDTNYGIRAFYFANEPPDFPEKLYEQLGTPQTFYVNYRWTM